MVTGTQTMRFGAALGLAVLVAVTALAHRDGTLDPAPASAGGNTIVVDTLADPGFAMSVCSLRAAIENANANSTQMGSTCGAGSGDGPDRITFSVGGTITLESALPAITDPEGLIISDDEDLVGIAISGDNSYRVFFVEEGASLTLESVTVEKGSATGGLLGTGGGIHNRGILKLWGSQVNDSGAALGGGIYNAATGTVTGGGSSVQNNLAIFEGGGIYNAGGGVVNLGGSDAVVFNVAGVNGGGIWNGPEATLTSGDDLVRDNEAGRSGGGIYNQEGTVTLGAIQIADNRANGTDEGEGGGGIYNEGGTVTVTGGVIGGDDVGDRNQAERDGGGVYNASGQLTLLETTVEFNRALGDGRGGGIYNESGEVTVADSEITRNVAGQGGAIGSVAGQVVVTGSVLSANQASYGGAVHNDSEMTVTGSSIITENEAAASGGGIYNESAGAITVMNSAISGNSAQDVHGGGVFNRGTAEFIGSIINGNEGRDHGGGIFNSADAVAVVRSSVVSGNEAGLDGGGIWNGPSGEVTVTVSTIGGWQPGEGNTADEAGGGVFNSGAMTVTGSTVTGNQSVQEGGGVRNLGGQVTLANSTVSRNAAGAAGAGIYTSGGVSGMTLTNVTVTNNVGSAALARQTGAMTVTNSIIADQQSGADCGAIPPASGGHNLDSDGTCDLTADGDISEGNAGLGPLADNGGATLTHALLEGSDAIDAGNDAVCAAPPVNGVDQRGGLRPHGKACDIGAFEFGAVIPLWGDIDCDGSVVIGDALKTARFLLALPVSQEPGCPGPGADVTVDGASRPWGDVDCDETVAIGDALKIARWLLGLSVGQEEGCPEIGTEVFIG